MTHICTPIYKMLESHDSHAYSKDITRCRWINTSAFPLQSTSANYNWQFDEFSFLVRAHAFVWLIFWESGKFVLYPKSDLFIARNERAVIEFLKVFVPPVYRPFL